MESDFLSVASVLAQVLIFVVGALILPTVRAMKLSVEKNSEELHKVQIGLVKLEAQMTGVEVLRANIHSLRNDLHTIQLQMALHGLLADGPKKDD